MKYAVVNAEYEHTLFQDITGPISSEYIHKLRAIREHLFYYINKDPALGLVSHHTLPQESVEYLQKNGIKLPNMVRGIEGSNWYGKLQDMELERKLNSKLFCYDLLKKFHELPENLHIVQTPEDIRKIVRSNPIKSWILKAPYFCGGRGITILETESQIPPTLTFPHILEPNLERIADLSIHYDPRTGKSFPYISYIKKDGTYQGGRVYQNTQQMDFDLKQSGLYDVFYQIVGNADKYINVIKSFNLQQPITIDSFIYKKDGEIKGYPMCEINYRISMGTLNEALKFLLPLNGLGILFSVKNEQGKDWQTVLPYSHETKIGILSLSGKNPFAETLLICAPNRNTLNRFQKVVLQSD